MHLALAQNLKNFIHSALTFPIPLSDCFRLPVRDRSYPTIVILWPRRIDIGVDKAAADFVPRRDCPRMISDPSSSGVKTSEEQPSWLLPRIWNISREILRRFAPETSQRSYNRRRRFTLQRGHVLRSVFFLLAIH